jgi:hypothetical protein
MQFTGDVHICGDILMVEFKVLMFEEVFNVAQVTCDQIVHGNNMKSFFDEPIAQVGSEESGAAGYEHALLSH